MATPEQWTAAEAAAAVRKGAKTFEFLASLLKRYDAELKFSNAVLAKDDALAALQNAVALEIAESTRTGKRFSTSGPLACVPFALSPIADVKGYANHGNNAALSLSIINKATADAPVIYALKKAGAELFSFANCSELNTRGLIAHPLQGLVKNPFTIHGVAGSGHAGVAALVAGHAVPVGIGLDTTGEVRVPAALCGCVGFRPSHGRYNTNGLLTVSQTLDAPGIVARTVEDVQLVDAVIAAGAPASVVPKAPSAAAIASLPSPTAAGSSATAPTASSDAGSATSPNPALATTQTPAQLAAAAAAEAETQKAAAEAAAKEAAKARFKDDDEFTKIAAAIKEEAALRLQAFSGSNNSSGAAAGVGVGASDPSFVAELKGVRVGLIRNFPCMDAAQSAVFEAFVERLKKRAGVEVVSLNFEWNASSSSSSSSSAAAAALGGADGAVTACLDKVIDPILGHELPREIAQYLSTHTALPPKPAPQLDDEGNEIPPAEPDPDDEEAMAAAAKAKIPRSMDTLVTLRNVIEAFSGTPADKALLMAQLESYTSSTGGFAGVSGRLYQAALVRKRVELQHYLLNDLFKQHKLDILLYPAAPLPPSPIKATEDTLPGAGSSSSESIVVGNGSIYYRYSRLASASGFPALSLPVGMTKPAINAVRGMPGSERLPVAVEVLAPHGNDVRLLAVARAFQGLQSLLPDPVVVAHWNEGVSVGVAK